MSYTLMGGNGDPAGTAAAAVAAHEADTTNVHGVTNTALLETTAGAQSKADTAQAAAIAASAQRASNLSDLASASTARTNLGLGGSATLAVGAVAGTVAAGDDIRIVVAASDYPSAGEVVPPRININSNAVSPTSGTLCLAYFTANKTESITTLTAFTGATAAGATPTLCRMGVYSVAGNGDLTLVASTVNDVTLFGSTNTAAPKALSSTWSKTVGQRYAVGVLVVSAAAMPSYHGVQMPGTGIISTLTRIAPAIAGRLTGQTDLPSPISAGSLVGFQGIVTIQMS